MNRRRFLLLAGGGLAAAAGGYVYVRGVRVPLLHLAGDGPVTGWSVHGVGVATRGTVFQEVREDAFHFRAFVPEPELTIQGDGSRGAEVVVENIHPAAQLEVRQPGSTSSISEDRHNLARSITIDSAGEPATVSWRFPKAGQYRFAAIGDTGGGRELNWVLRRASELGADFLIHVGDFIYEQGDLERAARNLNAVDIPVYAAIGNHDFSDGWQTVYTRFNRLIGPSNSVFSLGGVEFVNFDTAADFLPAERGQRARILNGLRPIEAEGAIRDRVAFTHMPLDDPRPDRDHAIGRSSEAQWLRERLLAGGTRNLLAGHIHIKEEFDDQGLHTYITGQGLAHADLITGRHYAEILLGDVEPGGPVRYQWQPLNMPFEAHCNARNLGMMDELDKPNVKARLIEQCSDA